MKSNNHTSSVSDILSRIPGLFYGFTTKADGDMANDTRREQYLYSFTGRNAQLIRLKQVHSVSVYVVDSNDERKREESDAIVYRKNGNGKAIALSVFGADCLPLLFVDCEQDVIGVAHAGWRGVIGGVVSHTIGEMRLLGANPRDIFVIVGPHICGQCYDVDRNRAQLFTQQFPQSGVVMPKGEQNFVSLYNAIVYQLRGSGVVSEKIESLGHCTFEREYEYFSYRRHGKGVGMQMGFIGYSYGHITH